MEFRKEDPKPVVGSDGGGASCFCVGNVVVAVSFAITLALGYSFDIELSFFDNIESRNENGDDFFGGGVSVFSSFGEDPELNGAVGAKDDGFHGSFFCGGFWTIDRNGLGVVGVPCCCPNGVCALVFVVVGVVGGLAAAAAPGGGCAASIGSRILPRISLTDLPVSFKRLYSKAVRSAYSFIVSSVPVFWEWLSASRK